MRGLGADVKSLRSWFLLFGCNLMWALQFTCIKLVEDQVGSLFTVWGPMTLATVMLYPLIRSEKREDYKGAERSQKDILMFFVLALVGVFPGQVIVTWGTRMSLASTPRSCSSSPRLTALSAKIGLVGVSCLPSSGNSPSQSG